MGRVLDTVLAVLAVTVVGLYLVVVVSLMW